MKCTSFNVFLPNAGTSERRYKDEEEPDGDEEKADGEEAAPAPAGKRDPSLLEGLILRSRRAESEAIQPYMRVRRAPRTAKRSSRLYVVVCVVCVRIDP